MSSWSIALLGAIAGFTIFLGLPFGRLRNPSLGLRVFLNGTAIGILLFLLWDVLAHAVEPVEAALIEAAIDQSGTWARFAELAGTVVIGVVVGLMSLVYYDRWMAGRRTRTPANKFGPGAASAERTHRRPPARLGRRRPAAGLDDRGRDRPAQLLRGPGHRTIRRERRDQPGAAADHRVRSAQRHRGLRDRRSARPAGRTDPGWGFLALLGLIGGGPTFVGTLIGQAVVSDILSVGFLALAAGSILYVVMQLLRVAETNGSTRTALLGLLLGLFLGFATDFIIVAAGA